ncbi:MAG TPA: ABC transporter permease [Terriglobia bacterium]|nr:ABC transporter permease [Terriglobia bacterium]
MSMLMKDFRYALRRLRLSPGFAAVCVITLALGIGANTAIFTLVNAVMLRSLPVKNPAQLYRLGDNDNCCFNDGFQDDWALFSYAQYQQFRNHTPEFSEMAVFQASTTDLGVRRSGAAGAAQPLGGEFVSGNYFSTFGIRAFAGRMLGPADDQPNAAPVVVMSYRTWETQFGLDPSVIGATFTINTEPYTVVGIAPPGFFGDTLRANPPDFWLPLATEPALNQQASVLNQPNTDWLYIVGRLKPNASPKSVQSEVTVELQRWLAIQPNLTSRERPQLAKQHIVISPGGSGVARMRDQTSEGLWLLMIISGLVLLIACANIANLLLARGAATRCETAIRAALGAPRQSLIRQILTESVLLAILGGVAGLFVAFAGTRAILLVAFRGAHYIPISSTPSFPVLAFAFLLSLVTGIVFGAAPAWITSHSNPAEALRGAGRSTRDRSSFMRESLVVLQVALSAVLLIGAGLLTESLRNIENQNFGFEAKGRLIVRVDPALAGYKPDQLYGLYQEFQQRLPQIPGVISASYSLYSPMRGDNWSSGIHIEGRAQDEQGRSPSWDRVGPEYFQTIGTRLLQGRTIGVEDTPNARRVAVVNQSFARKYFRKQDPIGKHFGIGAASHAGDLEIVGVVQDAKYQNAREPAYPTFFLPFLQTVTDKHPSYNTAMLRSNYAGDIELRVAGRPANLETAVRHALADINPNLTVLYMMSLPEQVDLNFNQDKLIARLAELFGLLALVLACVGLYGVTAYSVARRTSEIGIRMALGANAMNVLALILRGAVLQLGLGLAIGIPVALAGGRLLSSQLYAVKSYDPVILATAGVVLTACALMAGFVPARRAASIDPMQALRTE